MHTLKNWILLFASFLLLPGSLFAASCHATGPANTGSGSGADWNNVMKLPTAPVRGDTYYLEDGSYGTYTPTTATSGTSRITIKKAQSYDYGRASDGCSNDISAGWNTGTMGSSQAVFSGTGGTVSTTSGQGYYTFDGNGRTATAGCGVSPAVNAAASDCGIKIMASGTSPTTYGVLWINSTYDAGATRASGWIVRYVELAGAGDAGNTLTNSNEHTFYCRNGCNNLSIEHIYAHDSACDFMDIPYGDGVTVNLSHFKQNASSSNCHGQFFLGDGNQMNDFTWSNDLIQDVQGTAYWSVLNGGQASNWDIFNNVIFQTSGSSRPGISTGTVVVINSSSYADNINVIDNTWIGAKTDYSNHFAAYCDATCTGAYQERGSLYYGIIDSQDSVSPSPVTGPGAFTNAQESYNSIINSGAVNYGYTGTGDIKATGQSNPFVNWPSYNFHLIGNTANVTASLSLSAPFNVDAAGVSRPSGGVWNRGAFQFVTPPPVALNPTLFSRFDYPTLLIPGSDRQENTGVYSEIDNVTAWTSDGTTATLTANNNFQAGDRVLLKGVQPSGRSLFWKYYVVSSATSTSFVIPYTESAGSGADSTTTAWGITGTGFTGKGTWKIENIGTDTSETYKLYSQDGTQETDFVSSPSISGAPPYINFTVGSVEGTCSHTGTIMNSDFTETSTVAFKITFTSDDNPSVSHSHTYLVCHNGGGWQDSNGDPLEGKAFLKPGIRTVYTERNIPLDSVVVGNVNQMMNWTIETKPTGGNAGLLYATWPQPVFQSGTVPGLYRIKGCPAVDARDEACGHVTVIVSDHTSLPAANPDKIEQVPCDDTLVNAISWGSHYVIGPSQTYTDLLALPQTMAGPVLVQLMNEGAPGSPTEYHNQLQVNLPTGSPFADNRPAFFMCGVPNATTGEPPIVDGEDATVTDWASQYIVGPYSIIGITNGSNGSVNFDGNIKPFSYVTVEGIHIRNVTSDYQFHQAGNPTQMSNWGGSMGIRPYGIQFWSLIGNYFENVANPLFDDANTQQSLWYMASLDTFYEGNHLTQYGLPNDFLDHPMYLQAFRTTAMLNLLDGTVATSEGTSFFSDRGLHTLHQYNRLYPTVGSGTGAVGGGHSEIQDAYNYVNDDERWGYQGAPSCYTNYSQAPGCMGINGVNDMDWFAALDEQHSNTDFVIGNALHILGPIKTIGAAMTHNWESYQPYNCPTDGPVYPGNLTQKQWVTYNTITYSGIENGGLPFWEDTRIGVDNSYDYQCLNPQYFPRGFFANNILPTGDNVSASCGQDGHPACNIFNNTSNAMMTFQTNMVTPGAYDPGSSVTLTYSAIPAPPVAGIANKPVYYDWGGTSGDVNLHLNGWSSSNFLTYSSFPVDTTTLVPQQGSDAIGQATMLTGSAAYYPPRFNAVDENMSPFTLRTNTTTLGAYDPIGITHMGITLGKGSIFGRGVIR